MLVVFVALAVLAGAIAQRVSGMGFALVVAPVLVLLLGPFDGVLMVNLCGAVSALIVTTRVWRDIDWTRYLQLVIPALLAVVPGLLVATLLGGPVLQIVVGAILIVALTVSLLARPDGRTKSPVAASVLSGAASGFMNATAGIGGPALGIYAVVTRWEHRHFAATVQPFFVTLGTVSFVSKMVAGGASLPSYDWWLWVVVIVCTVAGLTLGEVVARVVSVQAARRAVIGVSYLGGLIALVDGIVALV